MDFLKKRVVVLDKGDEIIASLKHLISERNVNGFFIGIGAVRDPIIAYFDTKQKKYIEKNTGRWNFKEIFQKIETEAKSFINNEFEKRNTIKQELKNTLKLYGAFAQHLSYPPPETSLAMSLPTEQIEDEEWWGWKLALMAFIPVGVTLMVLIAPLAGIQHLIFGAKDNKKESYFLF